VAGRIPIGPAAIVPLSAKGRVMGILVVINRSGGPRFRQDDVDLLRTFAGQAALAIQQAQVRGELQRLSVIEERERLARELHDETIQSLYGITLDLASAAARARDPILRERMARLVWTVDGVIQDLRNHVYGLRSSMLAGRRLDAALRQLARDFEWQSGTTTLVEVETEAAERLHEQADDVVQIAREALSNVGRHARARSCRLHLGLHEGEAWLVVQDDGVGFDPGQVEARGHGLRNFEERATRLGGRLDIESSPNGGTELRIALPLPPPRHPSQQGRQRPNGARRRVLEDPR
jgi:signal transduction histidine kinase